LFLRDKSDLEIRSKGLFVLHCIVADQTTLFGPSLFLDRFFGLVLSLRPNSYLRLKIRAKAFVKVCSFFYQVSAISSFVPFATRQPTATTVL